MSKQEILNWMATNANPNLPRNNESVQITPTQPLVLVEQPKQGKRPPRLNHNKARRLRKKNKRLANNKKAKSITNSELKSIQQDIDIMAFKQRGLIKTTDKNYHGPAKYMPDN